MLEIIDVWLTTSKKKRWYLYTQNYPDIPRNTRKYLIIDFNTHTQPEPDLLHGIFSYAQTGSILKNLTRWALLGCLWVNDFVFVWPSYFEFALAPQIAG